MVKINNWLVLVISLVCGAFIGSYVIFMYGFNHFEASTIGMLTMLFTYLMLIMNKINRRSFK